MNKHTVDDEEDLPGALNIINILTFRRNNSKILHSI